ncbi:hypothetical protein [Synechococcus sp. MVIR-18-1]|uniref:hypothetical protein n=1 Tax=Synechococcus sp. MVIR-18-1 TaxID=1386941 RepID=UPI002102F4DB|nr:hypothetical protein [Synechococcus sp. MVIR-18-1]
MKMIPIVRDPVALSLFLVGNGAVFEEAGSTVQWGLCGQTTSLLSAHWRACPAAWARLLRQWANLSIGEQSECVSTDGARCPVRHWQPSLLWGHPSAHRSVAGRGFGGHQARAR